MSIRIFAVGDVFIDRPDRASAYHAGTEFPRRGDIVFGNCEGAWSDDWGSGAQLGSAGRRAGRKRASACARGARRAVPIRRSGVVAPDCLS
jgi:poly-gamma-glutamate synthesis protein (capsule biosynthesis protein)